MYLGCLFMLYGLALLSIVFTSKTILTLLISMEGLILGMFFMILCMYKEDSELEILMFLVVVVGESILGLVLMLLKVSVSGCDNLDVYNVV